MDCIFCKIIAGQIPAKVRYEDEFFVVFEDINPQARVHCLAVPKGHYAQLKDMTKKDASDLSVIMSRIPKVAEEVLGLKNGYRLIINQGEDAGQTVFHLHIHIIGGQKLPW